MVWLKVTSQRCTKVSSFHSKNPHLLFLWSLVSSVFFFFLFSSSLPRNCCYFFLRKFCSFSKPKTCDKQWARRQSGFAGFWVSKKQSVAPHLRSHPKRNADGASLNQTQKRTTTLLPRVHHKETTAASTPWQWQQPLLRWRKRRWLPPKLLPLLSD